MEKESVDAGGSSEYWQLLSQLSPLQAQFMAQARATWPQNPTHQVHGPPSPQTESPQTKSRQSCSQTTESPRTKSQQTESPSTESPLTKSPETWSPQTESPQMDSPQMESPGNPLSPHNSGMFRLLYRPVMLTKRRAVGRDEQVIKCLEAAVQEQLYQEALILLCLIHTMKTDHRHMLAVLDQLRIRQPHLPIPPHILLRKAMLLLNDGAVQEADNLLSDLLRHRSNFYRDQSEYQRAVAKFLQMKGQIRNNLGLWTEAAWYYNQSTFIAQSIGYTDQFCTSLQFIIDLLLNMNLSEYRLLRDVLLFSAADPISMADIINREVSSFVQRGQVSHPVNYLRYWAHSSDILLYSSASNQSDKSTLKRNAEYLQTLLKPTHSHASILRRFRLIGPSYYGHARFSFNLYVTLELLGDREGAQYALKEAVAAYEGRGDCEDDLNELEQVLERQGLVVEEDEQVSIYTEACPDEIYTSTIRQEQLVVMAEQYQYNNTEYSEWETEVSAKASTRPGFTYGSVGILDSDWPVEVSVQVKQTPTTLFPPRITRHPRTSPLWTCVRNPDDEYILNTNLTANSTYQANVYEYQTVDNSWTCTRTLVHIEHQLELHHSEKGSFRDVIELRYLHQKEVFATYVGKHYRKPTPLPNYHNDVIAQHIARYYVTMFNKELENSEYHNQVQMLPVVYMEILNNDNHVIEVLNVEPLIKGRFTKITNNNEYVNSRLDPQLLLAFSHFTWCRSGGRLMVTDLQGWLPHDRRVPVILTDPAINSPQLTDQFSLTNMAQTGYRAFWTSQHATCTHICELLQLHREDERQ